VAKYIDHVSHITFMGFVSSPVCSR